MPTERFITTFYFPKDFENEWKKFLILISKDQHLKELMTEKQSKKGLVSVALRELIKHYNDSIGGEVNTQN